MPLCHGLSGLGEHLVPVFHLHWSTLGTEYDLPDSLVSTHPVVIHDADDKTRLTDAFVRNGERKRLVENRIQRLLLNLGFLLLDLFAVKIQPDLHVWIYNNANRCARTVCDSRR